MLSRRFVVVGGLVGFLRSIVSRGFSAMVASGLNDARESLPVGLRVTHEPNPAKAREGVASGHRYTWLYTTTVSPIDDEVTIQEFMAFTWIDGKWIFSNYTKKPFGPKEFADWYACPDARLLPGRKYSDPSNWSANDRLQAGRRRWVYVGVKRSGQRVRGEAILEELGQLR